MFSKGFGCCKWFLGFLLGFAIFFFFKGHVFNSSRGLPKGFCIFLIGFPLISCVLEFVVEDFCCFFSKKQKRFGSFS